jgi:hypothetical protein
MGNNEILHFYGFDGIPREIVSFGVIQNENPNEIVGLGAIPNENVDPDSIPNEIVGNSISNENFQMVNMSDHIADN